MENYARTERISQESDGGEKSLCDLLHKASDVAGATLNSMQEIAGTTSCKGVQIASLEKWAHQENCWIDSPDVLGTYSDRGSENEVYVSTDMQFIFKLNDFRYSDDNLYFIDTIIYKSSEETINTYKSQSPRFNADK